jgi:8-oxo-dGTP pyrophosphatase MutT (NUDIX family)
MEKSAGLVIKYNNMLLLVHPSLSSWLGTFSFPKGKIENDETPLQAAIRETSEEVGLIIPEEWINKDEKIIYYTKKNKTYKRVHYFIVDLTEDKKKLLFGDDNIINSDNLQLEEIDWAGFLNVDEASPRIFWRFTELLELIR